MKFFGKIEFAIIVGCNCIFAGLLLIIYVIFNNVIYGIVFHTINSLIDSLFEILCTLFPLIYLFGWLTQ